MKRKEVILNLIIFVGIVGVGYLLLDFLGSIE